MAAQTPVAGTKFHDRIGNRDRISARLAAVADGDTYTVAEFAPTGIAWVEVSFEDLDAVAADTIAATFATNVITFQVTGASNDVRVVVHSKGPTDIV